MHDFHALRVAEVKRETQDAISVAWEVPPELRDAFRFKPGQHLTLRATIDGEEMRRNYSLCCGTDDRLLRIAIKRVAGGRFSIWANETLKAGATLDVASPTGRFVLPESEGKARHLVAFAAGAGITPIFAMLKRALAEPTDTFTLIYGNRSPQTILFREELEDLKDRHLGRFTLLHVLSQNEESGAPLLEGRITGDKVKALATSLFKPDEVAHAFLCGPGNMIKEARDALLGLGMARERVHFEFFAPAGAASRKPARPPQQQEQTATGGTEAVAILDGSRHRFTVPPGGRVVDAALAAGIRVPYACKGGMCCTCRAKLVEGTAEMVTNYSLEPWEMARGFILTCQAVPTSDRLVVDYDQM